MTSNLPYRPCVGLMLLNAGGQVFVGKRIDQTVMRELKEETGTAKAQIIGEMDDWLTYDLPAHLVGIAFRGRYRGQRQKWFALRFLGNDSDIDLHTHEPEFAEWKWVDMDALPGLIVPFKRDTYAQVIAAFRGLTHKS